MKPELYPNVFKVNKILTTFSQKILYYTDAYMFISDILGTHTKLAKEKKSGSNFSYYVLVFIYQNLLSQSD